MLSNESISDFSVEFCFLDLSQRAWRPHGSPLDDLASNVEEEGAALLGITRIGFQTPHQLGLLSSS